MRIGFPSDRRFCYLLEADFLFVIQSLMKFPFLFLILLSIACLHTLSGCAFFSPSKFRGQSKDASETLLKKSAMSPDSVVIEISQVNIPASRVHLFDDLWNSLDVTRIDLEQRKVWDRNGLRVATAGGTMPSQYQTLLEEEIKHEASAVDSTEPKTAPRRRLQSRSGKPFRIATKAIQPELHWFIEEKDGYRYGNSRDLAQPELVVRSFAKGEGNVRLLMVPEILFGEAKQVVTTANSSLRYEMKRDSITFTDLRLDTELALGESLVISASQIGAQDQTFGIGDAFFVNEDGSIRILVVRIAQTQQDDLFDPGDNNQPLESITE